MKKSKIIIAIAILLEKLINSAHNFSQILHLRGIHWLSRYRPIHFYYELK